MDVSVEVWLKLLTAAGGFATIGWALYQFNANQRAMAETRRIEATQPVLDRQLELYTAATQAAATLATSDDPARLTEANARFWTLHWGELALVEDADVEAAIVDFGAKLTDGAPRKALEKASLKIAHACRNSLADAWAIKQWQSPY
jgi:hypothetical protein